MASCDYTNFCNKLKPYNAKYRPTHWRPARWIHTCAHTDVHWNVTPTYTCTYRGRQLQSSVSTSVLSPVSWQDTPHRLYMLLLCCIACINQQSRTGQLDRILTQNTYIHSLMSTSLSCGQPLSTTGCATAQVMWLATQDQSSTWLYVCYMYTNPISCGQSCNTTL